MIRAAAGTLARILALGVPAAAIMIVAGSPCVAYDGNGRTNDIGDTHGYVESEWDGQMPTLACDPGYVLTGMRVWQGEWLAHVAPRCSRLLADGTTRNPGSAIMLPGGGGTGGDHWSDLVCPPGSRVEGIRGFKATVGRLGGTVITDSYAAQPILGCFNPVTGVHKEVQDDQFLFASGIAYNPSGDIGRPQNLSLCLAGRVADAILFQMDGDDIDHLALRCPLANSVYAAEISLPTTTSTNICVTNPAACSTRTPAPPSSQESATAANGVSASSPLPASHVFDPPTGAGGRVLAFCREDGRSDSCGSAVARTFCHQQGYRRVGDFVEGQSANTITLNGTPCSQRSARHPACRSFASITCEGPR